MSPAFAQGFALKCAQLSLNEPQAEYLFAQAMGQLKEAGVPPEAVPEPETTPPAATSGGIDPTALAQLEELIQENPALLEQLIASAAAAKAQEAAPATA